VFSRICYWELFVVSCWDEYDSDEDRIIRIHSERLFLWEDTVGNLFEIVLTQGKCTKLS